jgi:DNA-binding HxlR family transcriptional regulator
VAGAEHPGDRGAEVVAGDGGAWTSMLIKLLAQVPESEVRFAELRRGAPGISQKMLTATLRQLERDGLVARRVEATVPPRVHDSLTALGRPLDEPLAAIRDWAETHTATIDDAREAYDARPMPGAA